MLEQLQSGHWGSQLGLQLLLRGQAEGAALPPSSNPILLCPIRSQASEERVSLGKAGSPSFEHLHGACPAASSKPLPVPKGKFQLC